MAAARRQAWRSSRMENHKRKDFYPNGSILTGVSTLHAPISRIEDHNSGVLSCDFHHSGKYLLSSNRNGQMRICDIYGSFEKVMILKGHRRAVMQARFAKDGFNVYSASLDGTVGVWDTFRGFRRAKLLGHTAGVNCVQGARTDYPIFCSGSNDGTVRVWDAREMACVSMLKTGFGVTATSFSADGDYLFCGGIDNNIDIWDRRSSRIVCQLSDHKGKITGLSLSPCGSYLLSHSVDNTLRIWDIRTDATHERSLRCIPSYQHCADGLLRCAWSPDGTMISAGTSDRDVHVWDTLTGETIYSLPGHESGVNDVVFHPKEPVIMSASDDNYIFVHEMSELNLNKNYKK